MIVKISEKAIIRTLKLLTVIGLIIVTVYYCTHRRPQIRVMSGETMNTYYRVSVRDAKKDTLLHNDIKEELLQINHEMSVFDNTSDISEFNRNKESAWHDIPENLSYILRRAYQVYQQTGGYFDPSVGKLVDIWGFGRNKSPRVPSKEEIRDAQHVTGFNKISFDKDFSRAQKTVSDITLNLSAIAKGYGVDRIAKLLDDRGYQDYIIDIGGEVKAKGNRDENTNGWNLGIARPENSDLDNYEYVIRLQNMAVATSGDYRNYFYVDGKRYSHTIDPKTGYPVEHNLTSVTVFDQECMRADALATGIMSMGEDKGLSFANQQNLPVIMFVRTSEGLKTIVSKAAQKLLQTQNLLTE